MSDVTQACRDITELGTAAQKACRLFMAECKKRGLDVIITETYRSKERQNYLYSLGRTRAGRKVTWTKNSRHTSRCAWDICKNVKGAEYSDADFFQRCGEVAKKYGIVWGGAWSTPDMPHFEVCADWDYEEDKGMDELDEIKKELIELREKLAAESRVYNYICDMPEWALPTITKLYNRGIVKGVGNECLNLTMPMIRLLVMNDNAGLYD